jgi:cell wall assembly regulator SMI1
MTVTEQLKSILTEQYVSEDGDEYKVELLPGLTEQDIDNLAKGVPSGQIPNDIRELLKFASGFEFSGLEEITFNGIGQFGFEEIFPNSVQLAGDGFGNFWILDIDQSGNWGQVFFVCHDPAVVVKHSENFLPLLVFHSNRLNDIGYSGSRCWCSHQQPKPQPAYLFECVRTLK